MLQIIPIDKRKPGQVDTDTIKYIENIDPADSMTRKYNRAIESYVLNSNENIICFRHDDTEIRTPLDACEFKIRKLTEDHKTAVVGCIGTIAIDKMCGWWFGVPEAGGRQTYGIGSIIQGYELPEVDKDGNQLFDKDGKAITKRAERLMCDLPGCYSYAATVDGCCMWFPKWFFEEGFRFDQYLQSFHFYDADICLQALAAGYQVSTCDIVVKHESMGHLPDNWDQLRKNFYNKWNAVVEGQWPISRLSKFNMNNIKFNPANKDKVDAKIAASKTKEN